MLLTLIFLIVVKYEKGKTRPTANFDPKELETFKAELEQPTIKPAFESRQNQSKLFQT